MQALFVHGMGRSPLSGWPMLRRLRRAGLQTATFGYSSSLEAFPAIVARLAPRIAGLGANGPYVLIGHSLGGVLIRAALEALPPGSRMPQHVFLLGSPVRASRLARAFGGNPLFRILTGDCGQLLASERRMAGIGPLRVPSTGIFGVRGITSPRTPFAGEANDGVVSVSEIEADWIGDTVQLPVVHTLLPASGLVARCILERLAADA